MHLAYCHYLCSGAPGLLHVDQVHGVGMSQWGAQALARDGRGYQEILETFYPGTRVEHWSQTAAARP